MANVHKYDTFFEPKAEHFLSHSILFKNTDQWGKKILVNDPTFLNSFKERRGKVGNGRWGHEESPEIIAMNHHR